MIKNVFLSVGYESSQLWVRIVWVRNVRIPNQLQLLAAVALAHILKDNTAAVSTGTPGTIKVARIIQK